MWCMFVGSRACVCAGDDQGEAREICDRIESQ